jgi:D-glycero-alpha-D-manno-heptose-7-phosphate kinase
VSSAVSTDSTRQRPLRVVASACCRVDLAGGTLDIWPLGLLHRGACTVNVAVDVPVRVELIARQSGYRLSADGELFEASSAEGLARIEAAALPGLIARQMGLAPLEIRLESGSPRGGGLGASSALVVAMIAAAEALEARDPSTVEARCALARDLEAVLMGLPTGCQDHFPALLGGALELRHEPGGERVRHLDVDLETLGDGLVVAYSGESHLSAATNWQVVRRRLEAEPAAVECFAGIAGVAADVAPALEAGRFEEVGRLMSEEWRFRRRLAAEVSTPRIESLLERAAGAGAWGGKVCGAGGGGSIAILGPTERRPAIVEALAAGGAEVLPARPSSSGLEVTVHPML